MEDLLKLKDAQIEALQRQVELLKSKVEEANSILSDLVNEMEVEQFEIMQNGTK